MKKEYWLYAAAIVSGIFVWILVSALSGRREAWDSQWYFLVGMPVVCVVSACLAFFEPSRPWRWGMIPLAAQAVWMIVTQGPGNLLPIGLVVFGVLAIPSMTTAQIGAWLGKKNAARVSR
ncbi:MAG: hypothetical protein HY207_10035 [Nitrospirae bacterium]|nr:hypothetical protein [Nitrospirota bacterium]